MTTEVCRTILKRALLFDFGKVYARLTGKGLLVIFLLLHEGPGYADTPVIAVASNLNTPMTEIANAFKLETGDSVRLSFGASGNLARQIVQGAPYEIFITAGKIYIDFLISQNSPLQDYSEYIYGGIGYYIPEKSRLHNLGSLKEISNALIFNYHQKIAIANPDLAPYGVASMQALQSAGVWAMEKKRILLAENVSQVVPFALSGNVDIAIVPYAFLLQDNLGNNGKYFPIPENWHDRISQYIVEMKNLSQVSLRFRDFLYGESAKRILSRYGYHFIRAD